MTTITQSSSFIPDDDLGVQVWLTNFAQVVAADATAVGLTPADSTMLTTLSNTYTTQLALASQPLTRTTPVVMAKDAARNQAVETFRVYASQIKANLGVSDEMKAALGIHVDDTTRTPVPAPQTVPLLAIISAESGIHTLRFADSATPTSRAKPPGSIQLQVYMSVGSEPQPDPNLAAYLGSYTKQPIQVVFTPDKAGKTATYFARWITRTGLVGPWGPPVAMGIAFGGPIELQSAA